MLVYLQMIETPEDKTKFELIYIEYKGLMYHVAYEILNNVEDAEDAVHMAFVKVAENIQKMDEAVSPRTKSYLVTIVENKSIDLFRRRAIRQEISYIDETVGIQYEYEGSDDLVRCLAKLPARYREFFNLKYRIGFTNKEIGKMMDISIASVRQLEKRARDRLSEICEAEGVLC